jgi:hypothetical protein
MVIPKIKEFKEYFLQNTVYDWNYADACYNSKVMQESLE